MTSTETRPVVTGRPAWAEKALFDHDTEEVVGITYMWTAATVAQTVESNGETCPLHVYVLQRDDLRITADGVEPGEPATIHADDLVLTPDQARRFAAALIEAAARIDGAR